MSEAPNFHAEVRQLLRERALNIARELVCAEGWGAVNMSRVARQVKVSRPVLYKEFGTREDLAKALVERETDEFLAGIRDCLAEHPGEPVAGLRAAAEFTLRTGADNVLLKTILGGENHSTAGLLPLLATDPEPVLKRAVDTLADDLRDQYVLPSLDEPALRSVVEVFTRLTLSHLFQADHRIEYATEQIHYVVEKLLYAE